MRRREFPLSTSEKEQITMLAEKGLDAAEIARRMFRSKRSVQWFLRHHGNGTIETKGSDHSA